MVNATLEERLEKLGGPFYFQATIRFHPGQEPKMLLYVPVHCLSSSNQNWTTILGFHQYKYIF